MRRATASGQYLGAVTLVARNGKIVDWRAFGHRDVGRRVALEARCDLPIYR